MTFPWTKVADGIIFAGVGKHFMTLWGGCVPGRGQAGAQGVRQGGFGPVEETPGSARERAECVSPETPIETGKEPVPQTGTSSFEQQRPISTSGAHLSAWINQLQDVPLSLQMRQAFAIISQIRLADF